MFVTLISETNLKIYENSTLHVFGNIRLCGEISINFQLQFQLNFSDNYSLQN